MRMEQQARPGMPARAVLVGLWFLALTLGARPASGENADLSKAVILPAVSDGVQAKAADMLHDAILAHTGLDLVVAAAPDANGPAIVLSTTQETPSNVVPSKAEGYAIWVDGPATAAQVHLTGRDDRGTLFAAGRLVRLLDMGQGTLTLPCNTNIATAPDVPIRVHQLGFRNTANTYDAWDLATFEQYIRDLIVFGTNGIELIPTIDPELVDGPVMKGKAWDMNAALAELIDSYGLQVWLWAAVEDDVTTPEGAAKGIAARKAMFQSLKRVDAVFVPGGDDGSTPAEILMPWLGELSVALKETHPAATLWVSNQTFTDSENDYFFGFLRDESPDWLAGVVYGPWTKLSWEEMRERTPARYPIRRYPDITHTVRCQYPVPDWDPVFSNTIGREPMYPMPRMQAHIYLRYRSISDGFGTYSDGVHDDLNKCLWSALGWQPGTNLETFLEEYGRVFFGAPFAKDVARGLLMLEDNWKGQAVENAGIDATLAHWQAIADKGGDALAGNWRLQMYLFRAHYDAYVRHKALAERASEARARAALARARQDGVAAASQAARDAYAEVDKNPPAADLRKRIEELGLVLLGSIGYQLSVEAPYFAKNPERGAMLDWLDQPLNNRLWTEARLNEIQRMADAECQFAAIDRLVNWEDPGTGGFYDDLGNAWKQPHLVHQQTWEEDPGAVHSSYVEFPYYEAAKASEPLRTSWACQARTLYGTPLTMRYEDLDPDAQYRLRVTYAGRFKPTMTLVADRTHAIHGPLAQPQPIQPLEFHVPRETTRDGVLELEWDLVDGRGCQVAEVWLIKE